MDRIDKHYEHLNAEVLKPLKALTLENKPKHTVVQQTICDDYRCELKSSPFASPLFGAVVLHLNLANTGIGDDLENLDGDVITYNDTVDSTEYFLISRLENALHSRNLQYEHLPQQVFINILNFLSHVWEFSFFKHLDEPFDSLSLRIEQKLDTWRREDNGPQLILDGYTVWQEQKADEKGQVIQAIREVASDHEVLDKLALLERTKRLLERKVWNIATYCTAMSKSIESLTYSGRAKCCYANIPWLIRRLV